MVIAAGLVFGTAQLARESGRYTVAALDCRGQGGLSEDNGAVQGWTLRGHIIRGLDDAPEKLYYRQMFLDTAQLAKIGVIAPLSGRLVNRSFSTRLRLL